MKKDLILINETSHVLLMERRLLDSRII